MMQTLIVKSTFLLWKLVGGGMTLWPRPPWVHTFELAPITRFRSEKATTKGGVTGGWNVTAAPRVPRQEGPKNPKARKTTEPPSQPTQSFKLQTQFQRSTSTAGKVSYVSLRFSCLKGATTYTGNLLRERPASLPRPWRKRERQAGNSPWLFPPFYQPHSR